MATPHISAAPGDFAPAVLFPGDPLRAERIAREVLTDARQVTGVRGMLGYTGTYQGKDLSVMGSGMGIPSASIYATELLKLYGVRRIVRVGTSGGISAVVNVGDVVIALGAHTDSAANITRIPGVHFAPVASFGLAQAAYAQAQKKPALAAKVHVGPIISRDHFYYQLPGQLEKLKEYGVLCVEMEAAGIYAVAQEFGQEALAVLTVSDHLGKEDADMTATERETVFADALELAIAAALS